jgi:hypothetical protein
MSKSKSRGIRMVKIQYPQLSERVLSYNAHLLKGAFTDLNIHYNRIE